jgi:hypothetical protein
VAEAGGVARAGEEGQLVLVSHRGQGRGGGGGGGGPHRRAIRPCDGHTESWAAISGRIVGVLMEVVEGEAEHGVRCGRLHTVLIE